MRPWLLVALLSVIVVATAHSDDQSVLQEPLQTYPGFDLDLSALRWVQLEGQDPVLMTELEKVRVPHPFCPALYSHTTACHRSTSRQQE